jgi:hypothetical protein
MTRWLNFVVILALAMLFAHQTDAWIAVVLGLSAGMWFMLALDAWASSSTEGK